MECLSDRAQAAEISSKTDVSFPVRSIRDDSSAGSGRSHQEDELPPYLSRMIFKSYRGRGEMISGNDTIHYQRDPLMVKQV